MECVIYGSAYLPEHVSKQLDKMIDELLGHEGESDIDPVGSKLHIIVLFVGESVVASCEVWGQDTVMQIWNLGVVHEHQRRGYCRFMIAVANYLNKECKKLEVIANKTNLEAQQCYRRLGFRKDKETDESIYFTTRS